MTNASFLVRGAVAVGTWAVVGCGGSGSHPEPTTARGSTGAAQSLVAEGEVHFSSVRQLTEGQGENAEAYWSFDGRELVFQSTRSPYQCDQIFRVPADGSAAPTLVSTGTGRTTCGYFGHENRRIVYASTHENSKLCPPVPDRSQGYVWPIYDSYEIYSTQGDGSELVNLTRSPGYDAEATVCAVDGSIIFTSTRDGDLDLYRMDADGNNVKRLTSTPGYDGGAFFSQDCKQIVWRASRPTGKDRADYERLLKQGLVRPSRLELFVANADGTEPRQVTYLGAASFAPYLHPSGRRILFSTNYPNPRGREFDIWAINTDGTELERITYAPGFDGFPMFSPDGTQLAFGSNRNQKNKGETDVYVAEWVESPPVKVQFSPADRVLSDIAYLADDAREGRGAGTQGNDESARWVAQKFAELGVQPAFPDYLQTFEVPVAVTRGDNTALTVRGHAVDAASIVPASFSASGTVSGRTVDVGYGIVAPELGIDDYNGKKVRGNIAVVHRFLPPGQRFVKSSAARRKYSDLHYKAFLARERGAVAVVFVDAPIANVKLAKTEEASLPPLTLSRNQPLGIPVLIANRKAAGVLASQSKATVTVELKVHKRPSSNVVGVIRGANSDGRGVVVGAHYDHLGMGGDSSLEPGVHNVHNGADDNASGTAGLIEVARLLRTQRRKLDRDIYLVAFTAEEIGLVGSNHFVRNPPKGLDVKRLAAMLNMDMIGRLRGNTVAVLGGTTAAEWDGIVTPLCAVAGVHCTLSGSGYGPSDQTPFYAAGVPVLQFFTGAHGDYHKTSDDTAAVNAVGAARVAQIAAGAASQVATATTVLTYKRVAAPLPAGDSRSFGASMGTIPDYSAKVAGVMLAGVRPGGPAEKAGLQRADRIVSIGRTTVKSVRDLMYVLRRAKPGDKVVVTAIRDGKRVRLPLIFGKSSRPHRQ